MLSRGRRVRTVAGQLASACLFAGGIAAVVTLLGTRDLESYEHVFFSLDRGTAVESVHALGQPVYTLALGLGVRLPLQGSLGASPAARIAPYLPAPLTYGLLITFAIAAAVLLVRHALQPLCGRTVTWLAAALLFCSLPMATYTIYGDWPELAVTYCAFIACVFAPHALLALVAAERSRNTRRVAGLAVPATVWSLVAISHAGYWPLVAAALVSACAVALGRTDYPRRTRIAVVTALGAAAGAAVVLQAPDILREVTVAGDAAGMRRLLDEPKYGLISANLFPFGPIDPEMPFGWLVLALVSLLIGLTSANARSRRLIVSTAIASIMLSGAATLPPGSSAYAVSSTWALRDPAAAFAVFSAACAVPVLRAWRDMRYGLRTAATLALALAALQGPAYAASLVIREGAGPSSRPPWTRDMTSPEVRASNRGLAPDRVPPGERLALWPKVRNMMRNARRAGTDFADAGHLLVTAWTKQRTMRGLVEPNEYLFNQEIELPVDVLCDVRAVSFLQLHYLLRPAEVAACAPWAPITGVRVDGWLDVDAVRDDDRRLRALPVARLGEPLSRRPALSEGSALLPSLVPLSGTSVTIAPPDVVLRLADPSMAAGQALVLPVAYDTAWRTSSGQTHNVGGLLALVGVEAPRVALAFVPDRVAILRALSLTLAQLLALAGLLGLAYATPTYADDPLGRQLHAWWRRIAASRTVARLREPRAAGYLVFSLAIGLREAWMPEDSEALLALMLPLMAIVVAGPSRVALLRRWGGAAILGAALISVAVAGSRSAAALHDPLFWALVASVALGISAIAGRWPLVAFATAAAAGAGTAVAMLLPLFPDFDARFPVITAASLHHTWLAFSGQFGAFATLCLLALWIHAIGGGAGAAGGAPTRSEAAIRGALFAGLLLSLAGAVPSDGLTPNAILVLGTLFGLSRHRPFSKT